MSAGHEDLSCPHGVRKACCYQCWSSAGLGPLPLAKPQGPTFRELDLTAAVATAQARIEELGRQLESVTAQRDVARALADATGHSDLVAQRNRAVTELASVKAELHRWQHGHQVEGDYVCPLMPDLDEANIVIERGAVALRAAQKRIEELEAALTQLRGDPRLWRRGGAGGQDEYAGLPPAMRIIDAVIRKAKP